MQHDLLRSYTIKTIPSDAQKESCAFHNDDNVGEETPVGKKGSATRPIPPNEVMYHSISRYMDKAFQEPSEGEKTLANKKLQLEIEAISVSNEVARNREARENQMANVSKTSLTLADLLKIVATPGLSPSMKEEAENGIRLLMSSMVGSASAST